MTVAARTPGNREKATLIDDYYFFRDQWQERNRIIAGNIIKAAKEYHGKRLVVLTGATHRYILRDLLKNEPSIDLKEYWEVIEPKVAKSQKRDIREHKADNQVNQTKD